MFKKPMLEPKTEYLVVIGLFLIAFIPRIADLGTAIVADEQLWILRSKEFARALMSLNFPGTRISDHPGVITMWLGGVSIGVANILYGFNQLAELLFAAQLPFALATSVIIILFFYFSRKAFNPVIASISTAIFAFSPFYLAYSRIIHLDAILSGLMILSFMGLLVFFGGSGNRIVWLIVSALLGGLSILEKVPGVFMIPMTGLVFAVYFVLDLRGDNAPTPGVLIFRYIRLLLIWLIVAYLTCFILWPAMWSDPLTIVGLFVKGPGMVAHEHGQFLLGKPVDDPGALFYILVIIFRTTPLSLVFFLSGAVVLVFRSISKERKLNLFEINLWLCLAFIFFFFIMMSIPDKKAGRYILPLFPAIAIIAGAGIHYAWCLLTSRLNLNHVANYQILIPTLIAGIFQVYSLWAVYPHFLSYYNPIAGGPKSAEKALLIGRGEGMDLVAAYLNDKRDAPNLTVASEFQYLLHVHFKGKVKSTHREHYDPETLKECDYLVVYISGLQKKDLRIAPEVYNYHNSHTPEKVITINHIKYAYIYKIKNATISRAPVVDYPSAERSTPVLDPCGI